MACETGFTNHSLSSREFKDADIEDEIREAFRVFDKEGNGFITTPDLMEVQLALQ